MKIIFSILVGYLSFFAILTGCHEVLPNDLKFGGSNGNATNYYNQQTAPSKIYVASKTNGIYISSYGGNNWNNTSNAFTLNSIFVKSSNVYVGSVNGLFTSFDNGVSWNIPSSNGTTSVNINQITSSGITLCAATTWNGVAASFDNGANWNLNYYVRTFNVLSVYTVGSYIFAGMGSGSGIFIYDRTSWNNYAGIGTDNLTGIYATGSPPNYTVYAANVNGLYKSTDGGISWGNFANLATGLPSNNVICVIASGNNIFTGTDSGLSV